MDEMESGTGFRNELDLDMSVWICTTLVPLQCWNSDADE